jgi:dTDP-4-dehydrorhamnose 3,5-epimerase-like enzyme
MIQSVKLIELPYFKESNGDDLVVVEGQSNVFPFSIMRMFSVRSEIDGIRGRHAHRRCTQFLICINGAIEVQCDDSIETRKYVLDKANYGLLIPPRIWAEQKYIKENTVLTVLCDRPFDESDYIRDYKEFLKYVRT